MLRHIIIITVIFSLFLFGVPFLFGDLPDITGKKPYYKDSFRLKLTETGEVMEISAHDYIIGCLFAQIPISYHEEALKAQAVAAYTYALRLVHDSETSSNSVSKDYDISDDTVTSQPYFTEDAAAEFYGEEYAQYYDKISAAAEYGVSRVIEYNHVPVYAVYHSVSAGVTNTGEAVWGRSLPYLQSADSGWDSEYENFTCVNEMTVDRMRGILLEYDKNISMPVDYNLWFTDPVLNAAGYVESITAGGKVISGGDMWRIFNLRSTDFTVRYTGSVFEFTTEGYGHGAGLSQFGADYMARSGYSAEEIITHYYTGVTIIVL